MVRTANLVREHFYSTFLTSSLFSTFHALTEGRETKKRTTLARLLKGLKTVNRRDRTNNQNATPTTSTQVRVSSDFKIDVFINFIFCAFV